MLKDERIIIHHRSSLRGLKKCPSCYQYNGNRAKSCTNKNCPLYNKFEKFKNKSKINLIDPIQLITYNNTKIYSVRCKERINNSNNGDQLNRNFVQITDTTLSSSSLDNHNNNIYNNSDSNDNNNSIIISRNAICYVDTCKYDSNDINLSCKHVKSATECHIIAQEIKISKDILFNMKINTDFKINLWNLYNCNEFIIPILQRINKTTFIIKCLNNHNFPSSYLHLVIFQSNNDINNFNYICSCKKLEIQLSSSFSSTSSSSLSSNNKNIKILENNICDHLLILLAGILSSSNLKNQYQNLCNALKSFWDHNDFQNDVFDNDDFLPNGVSLLF